MGASRSASRSKNERIEAFDELLRTAEISHGIRSQVDRALPRPERGGQAARNHRVGRNSPGAQAGKIEVIRVPVWSRLPWLIHGFSTRTGGRSLAYTSAAQASLLIKSEVELGERDQHCGELNLGFTESDPESFVNANRADFLRAVRHPFHWPGRSAAELPSMQGAEMPAGELVVLKQIHSSLIRVVSRVVSRREVSQSPVLIGDGLMTDEPGVMVGILTADCIPVLIADRKRRAVAAFHAGWRGTLKRIVENGVGRMRLEFGSQPEDLVAAIGPGIGQCCYSVGNEIRNEFQSQFGYAEELFCEVYDVDPVRQKYPMLFLTARAPGHSDIGPAMHLDLMEANKRQLLDAGLRKRAIYLVGECTSCRTDRFFSHRAEHGFSGRMLSVIGIA